MVKTNRLGKGLSALIPDISESEEIQVESGKKVLEVDPRLIKTNPYQPRLEFDSVALNELKSSIQENGLIQPLAVRMIDGNYELIAGERRLRCVLDLDFDSVPVYLMDIDSKEEMLEIALIENVQREKLNVIEQALSYKRLIEECNLTIEKVAQKIGKDRSTINNILRLLKLPSEIHDSLKSNGISMGHARAILALEDRSSQIDMLHKIKSGDLSVRKVEALIKKVVNLRKEESNPNSIQKSRFHSKVENTLRQSLGTQVTLVPRKKGGSIDIQFYSDEDLERLLELFEGIDQ